MEKEERISLMANVDKNEIDNFDQHASEWWNPRGPYKMLHKLNPLRLKYIGDKIDISGKTVLDIGCGGGILSEELSKKGATVYSIDASEKTIRIAKDHAKESNLEINYQCCTLDQFIKKNKIKFDCIICFELIEHVPDPQQLLSDISKIAKKDSDLFLSTINRNIESFLLAKVVAEYILRIVPKGTHEYDKFLKPSEVSSILTGLNFKIDEIKGMILNIFTNDFELSKFTNINYFVHAKKNK